MQNNFLIFFFSTFPILYLLNRVLPLLKIPKSYVILTILIVSLFSCGAMVAQELNSAVRLFLIGSCMMSVLIKSMHDRITFYKILVNHYIMGMALLAQFEIISLQTMLIMLSILPLVDMKNESLKAMVNQIVWLFLFFTYLIISKINIEVNFVVANYFVSLFYLCGVIFLLNRRINNLSGAFLIFAFFNVATKQMTLFPILHQYFLISLQILFLFNFIKNKDCDNFFKVMFVFALLNGSQNVEYNLVQVLIIGVYLIIDFYNAFKFKIIKNIELILLAVVFLTVLQDVSQLNILPKVSAISLGIAIYFRIVNKTKSIAHFVHS